MAIEDSKRAKLEALLDRLNTLRIDGSSMGGPHVGIGHNDLTREIVAAGKEVVPLLVSRLPNSSFDESVYIVFMLRELHASEAQAAIYKLKSEVKERSVGRDLTLKMQVEYFLREAQTWQ